MAYNQIKDINWFGLEGTIELRNSVAKSYDDRIVRLLESKSTVHICEPSLFEKLVKEKAANSDATLVVWYEADPDPQKEKHVKQFAGYFGIWHQLIRGSHESMHEIYFQGVKVLLINTFQPKVVQSTWFTSYTHQTKFYSYKPQNCPSLIPKDFFYIVNNHIRYPDIVIPSDNFGDSCNDACSTKGLSCDESSLLALNFCATLQRYFQCASCELSIGPDQPCFVDPTAEKKFFPGSCLLQTDPHQFSCSGKHKLTKRICPCK